MSVTQWVTLTCDGRLQGGALCFRWDQEGGGRSVSVARASAKRRGWARRGGKDLCPDCQTGPHYPNGED
jgi:hypothetical protein